MNKPNTIAHYNGIGGSIVFQGDYNKTRKNPCDAKFLL